jgi:hypothetical protein
MRAGVVALFVVVALIVAASALLQVEKRCSGRQFGETPLGARDITGSELDITTRSTCDWRLAFRW